MKTIFDELEDEGYAREDMDDLRRQYLCRLDESQIRKIFVGNAPLKRKLMHALKPGVSRTLIRDGISRGAAFREFAKAMVKWEQSLPTDPLYNEFGPFPKSDIVYGVPGTVTDPRDGRVYRTVQLQVSVDGNSDYRLGSRKIWLAENLQFDAPGSFARETPESTERFGRLYGYDAAEQAVIPGWRLPTPEDVADLIDFSEMFIGAESVARTLKGKSFAVDSLPEYAGEDSFGFNALPAGYRDEDGDLVHEDNMAAFWIGGEIFGAVPSAEAGAVTSAVPSAEAGTVPSAVPSANPEKTSLFKTEAFSMSLSAYNDGFDIPPVPIAKTFGLSVRLVKDGEECK